MPARRSDQGECVTVFGRHACEDLSVRYFQICLIAGAVWSVYHCATTRPVHHGAGILVEEVPRQALIEDAAPISHKGFELTPRAQFSAEVRVLSVSGYRLDKFAEASPLDIAVGWAGMSDSAVLEQLEISQSGRFYFWHYDDAPPIPRADIESQSANWHLVPANARVWSTLRDIRIGDVVTLKGMLIDMAAQDGSAIKTSLRRDDTGAGACEVVFVEAASLRE